MAKVKQSSETTPIVEWFTKGWGAAIVALIAIVGGAYLCYQVGYGVGKKDTELDYKDKMTNMRIDFQEKLALAKDEAEKQAKAELADLAKDKKDDFDKLYALIKIKHGQ